MTDKTPGEKAADRLDQERLDFAQRVLNVGALLALDAAEVMRWVDEPGAPVLGDLAGAFESALGALRGLADEHDGAPWARA